LARELFNLRGVDQLHFFENVVTVTKFSFEPWKSLEPSIKEVVAKLSKSHDPESLKCPEKKDNREGLSPDLRQIEEILDRRIRPGLQGDGGDLTCESFEDNILMIKYQGACGTCPSSTMGTLEAIRGILQDEYDPDIEVYIAPEL
jgi:Fe-S cluster biogenesis protein NfuA